MPALDTHTVGISDVSNAFTLPNFDTDTTNEIVCVIVVAQSGSGAGSDGQVAQVSSVSDTAGLTWAKRTGFFNTDANVDVELWYAKTAAKLTADQISVFLNRTSRSSILAFAVTGLADITDPFDANATNPTGTGYPNASGASPPLSTNQARSLLILACGVFGNASAPTASTPFSVNAIQHGTYCTAFLATNQRTAQANNVQSVVQGNSGAIEDLSILGDAFKGPGWLRYDFFVGGG